MQKVFYLLSELTDDDIDWILAVSERQEWPSGKVLMHEGQRADFVYLVLDGTLEVVVDGVNHQRIAELYTGDTVGEMSFIDTRPPSATVRTLESSLLIAIPKADLAQKLEFDAGFAARFYRALAVLLSNRLRETVRRVRGDQHEHEDLSSSLDEDTEAELRPATERLELAKVRFDWMIRRLRSGDITESQA